MLPGSRVLTASDYEQQRDSYREATAICLWCVQLATWCGLLLRDLVAESFYRRACFGGLGSEVRLQEQRRKVKIYS